MQFDTTAVIQTFETAARRLLEARTPAGRWVGHLSSSALSTATAAFALHLVDPQVHRDMIDRALRWLCGNRNADGGWGDTPISRSNISTTLLALAALSAGADSPAPRQAIAQAEGWIAAQTGSLEPAALAEAVERVYGEDRSFSAPILAMCALAGRLGEGRD
ncbi:MAG TPA: prenyltransferase/squalene oxidase repeat-containing protein, partial [Phycisphaerae bacterium]|nr:prenyltransferase/squalene oxidase repeat-containing protein [Phycisphaerae bacterium]